MTTVVLKNLTRRFGDVVAVDNLNLAVESGEMVAFLGPSGCGKTTTLRMITGLLAPSDGDVLFDGRSILSIATEKRGAVMVFQKHLLFPTMNVAKNVGFGLRMQKVNKREIDARVSKMLELVHLPGFEERRAHELSGGQQQRVALARALIVEPKVLLLDEPLANLDANLRLEMRELIRQIQRELGITSIFVTHDQEEAVMLADRVALMFDGKVQQFDVPHSFYEWPRSAKIARFFRNNNFLQGVKAGMEVKTPVGTFQIDPAKVEQPDGPVLVTVRPEEISLDGRGERNKLIAPVKSIVYMGAYTQVLLDVGGNTWQARGPADLRLEPGEPMRVQLPRQHIWLLPDEG